LKSDDAGTDLWRVLHDQAELALEIVFSPTNAKQSGPARIVALADDGQPANFALSQDGSELVFQLQTAGEPKMPAVRFPAGSAAKSVHLTVTYRDGELTVYRDGAEVARSEAIAGPLAWREGPLTLGASASGQSPWLGTVEALAIHGRCLDAQEVTRNARSYRLLAAPAKDR
jgi:hypothetical protein